MGELAYPSKVEAQVYSTPSEITERPPQPAVAPSQTMIKPSITVSERYDSNVFFVQGKHLQDYVTTATPKVGVDHKGRLVDFLLEGGISANYYLRNPGLSFIGDFGTGSLDLSRAVSNVVRGASLQVSDVFVFTPQPPAFLAPTTGNVVETGFVHGIQAQRANSYSNMGKANAGYQLSPTTSLQASYVNSMMHFGSAFTPPGQSNPFPSGSFFSTQYQTVTAGPKFQVSPRDSMSVNYRYQQMNFTVLGISSAFFMQGGVMGWTRQLTPTLKASVTGGFTTIGGTPNPQYLGSAFVGWTHGDTSVTAQYSRSVTPSFFLKGLPLVNQSYSLTASHQITERLSVIGTGSYSLSTSAVSGESLTFTSYYVYFGMTYRLAEHVSATASYAYYRFLYNELGFASAFNRNVVMLSIRAEW